MTTPGSLVFSRFKFLLGLRFEELYAIDRAEKQPNLVYFDLGGILNYLSEIYFEPFFVIARRAGLNSVSGNKIIKKGFDFRGPRSTTGGMSNTAFGKRVFKQSEQFLLLFGQIYRCFNADFSV